MLLLILSIFNGSVIYDVVDQDFTEYTNLEECITYLCDYITSKGPFDGLLGFSQVCLHVSVRLL